MAAGDTKIVYIASSNISITLASLATDASLLTGRESPEVDNSTNRAVDCLLSGKITTGTSPTASRLIEVHVVGLLDDSTWPSVFDGTDSAETVTAAVKAGVCRLAASIDTTSTSDVTYYFGPVSVASLFGGVLPKKFVVFVTHNTGVNLNSTSGNHQITVTPIYYNTAQS
jgi:hypothetical protein